MIRVEHRNFVITYYDDDSDKEDIYCIRITSLTVRYHYRYLREVINRDLNLDLTGLIFLRMKKGEYRQRRFDRFVKYIDYIYERYGVLLSI